MAEEMNVHLKSGSLGDLFRYLIAKKLAFLGIAFLFVEQERRGVFGTAGDPSPLNWSIVYFNERRIKMATKRHKPKWIVSKWRQVDVLVGNCQPRIDAIRQVQITEQTYYRWRM